MKKPKEEISKGNFSCKRTLLIILCLFLVPFLAYKLKQICYVNENIYGYDEPAVETINLYLKYDRNSDGIIDIRSLKFLF